MEWLVFAGSVGILLTADIIFTCRPHDPTIKEATLASCFWIACGVLFGCFVGSVLGWDRGSEYFTAYIVEKSLSVDNLFVFVALFSYFQIDGKFQHKVLTYGILGAIVMRALCIFSGVALLQAIPLVFYALAVLLIYTGYKLATTSSDDEPEFETTWFAKALQKYLPFSLDIQDRFFAHIKDGKNFKFVFTRLAFAVAILEFTDLVFATDSIPAALGCSNSAFVIYASNIFAILGLRALYFVLRSAMLNLPYLKYGICLVLMGIGVKMLLHEILIIETWQWLTAVVVILTGSALIRERVDV